MCCAPRHMWSFGRGEDVAGRSGTASANLEFPFPREVTAQSNLLLKYGREGEALLSDMDAPNSEYPEAKSKQEAAVRASYVETLEDRLRLAAGLLGQEFRLHRHGVGAMRGVPSLTTPALLNVKEEDAAGNTVGEGDGDAAGVQSVRGEDTEVVEDDAADEKQNGKNDKGEGKGESGAVAQGKKGDKGQCEGKEESGAAKEKKGNNGVQEAGGSAAASSSQPKRGGTREEVAKQAGSSPGVAPQQASERPATPRKAAIDVDSPAEALRVLYLECSSNMPTLDVGDLQAVEVIEKELDRLLKLTDIEQVRELSKRLQANAKALVASTAGVARALAELRSHLKLAKKQQEKDKLKELSIQEKQQIEGAKKVVK